MARKAGIQALMAAREKLAAIQKSSPELARQLQDVLDLLKTAEMAFPTSVPVVRRTGTGIKYSVDEIGGRPLLTEHRTTGTSKPFRVGKEIFNAVVDVLATSERPKMFDEIMDGIAELTQPKPGEFQVRMVLRFLLRAEPALLLRRRNRYARDHGVATGPKFKAGAKKSWDLIAHERHR